MTALPKKKIYTPEEYLALEDSCEYRSEYVNGDIFKLAGGTETHNDISLNTATQLRTKLRGKCKAFVSDMKVWVEEAGTFFYPDITLVCGERNFYKNRRDTILNPILLVEVLSRSTEEYDKNDKFLTYQKIESFQEYVLISQNQPAIQQYIRQANGEWKYKATIGLESKVLFESVNMEISLEDIYDLVEFENKNL
ncbi:MAG: Uma2 family endonuclease [Pyrinomonadaceae bacterium]